MKNVILTVSCALMLLIAPLAAAQDPGAGDGSGQGSGRGSGRGDEQASTNPAESVQKTQAIQRQLAETEAALKKLQEAQNPRFVRTLTNVQVELTLTETASNATPDKKTVSMVVSSGSWGKIRSTGSVRQVGEGPVGVDLNVDARPFVSVDGPIQLEVTLNYSPPGSSPAGKDNASVKTGINQSLTVILQSGKPLIISQSADPVTDRKVVVEVKATVLK